MTNDNKLARELLRYSAVAESQVYWLTRSQYLSILNSFLNKEISLVEFRTQFVDRRNQNQQAIKMLEKNLIILPANRKALDFTHIIEDIYEECEFFPNQSKFTLDSSSQSERIQFESLIEEFKTIMKDYYHKMLILNEE